MSYSENEKKLFRALGCKEELYHLPPTSLYTCVTLTVFVENLQGPHVDALRRAIQAVIVSGKPYRNTPEFENLIKF